MGLPRKEVVTMGKAVKVLKIKKAKVLILVEKKKKKKKRPHHDC
jgi:hypothetical protein